MKILEHAEEVFTYVFTCTKCGSKCEADASDLTKHPGGFDPREQLGWDEHFTVACGVCYHSIDVPAETIPALVRIRTSTVIK